jgi:hypothetical protein
MKRSSVCIALLLLFILSLNAQSPNAFKYQAVARDTTGNIIADKNVRIRITIVRDSSDGVPVYIENHLVQTNSFGLMNIEIGKGNGAGNFQNIDWGRHKHFIKTEMDPAGGINYSLMGISQLLSVPYALYSESTSNVNDADADSTNELQKIFKLGNIVFLSDSGGSFIDEVNDADHSVLNEVQHLYFDQNTNELSITAGNTITLPSVSLPAGTTGQTLRNSGGNWMACSNLYNNGNKVGIGTSLPVHKLDILGTGKTNLRISSTNHSSGLELVRTGGSNRDYRFLNENDQLGIYSDTSDFLSTTYNKIMSLTYDGKVGIGVADPSFKLHVKNTSGTAIYSVSEPDTSCAIFAASNGGIGLIAEHNSNSYSNPAIIASNYGKGAGIYSESNGEASRAIHARAASSSGENYAIYGITESQDGYAGYFEGGKNYFEGVVGLGTTNPTYTLDIQNHTKNRSISIINNYSGALNKCGLFCQLNADGTGTKYGIYSDVENGWAGFFNSGNVYIADDLRVGNAAPVPGFKISVDGDIVCERLKVEADDINPAIRVNNTGTGDGIYVDIDNPLSYAGYFVGGMNYFEGNIGIGTPNPDCPLQINSSSTSRTITLLQNYNGYSNKYGIKTNITSAGTGIRYGEHIEVIANSNDASSSYGSYIQMTSNNTSGKVYGIYSHCSSSGSGEHYGIYSIVPSGWAGYFADGNVYIDDRLLIGDNTGADGYKVSIDGKVMCEELKVQSSAAWPDYVFDEDYKLPDIDDLENSILVNKHLPGMPSAATINKDGITLGEMSKMQMEKIEELTLYIIELNKKIEKLEDEVRVLKAGSR